MHTVRVERDPSWASLEIAGESIDDRWERRARVVGVSLALGPADPTWRGPRLSAAHLRLSSDGLLAIASGHASPPAPVPLTTALVAEVEHEEVSARKAKMLAAGVALVGGGPLVVGPLVEVSPGAVLGPHTVLVGRTVVGARARIDLGCHLRDTTLAEGAHLRPYTVCDGACLAEGASAGPFAHLRPATSLGPDARVGNFVEAKRATLAAGVKAGHLSYLGDCEIGEGVNVGAGTITCNYDGGAKHLTRIDADAFIGTNTSLVAPVHIGQGALVAAGSTITEDVPADALALARARQVHLDGRGRDILRDNRARPSSDDRDGHGDGDPT